MGRRPGCPGKPRGSWASAGHPDRNTGVSQQTPQGILADAVGRGSLGLCSQWLLTGVCGGGWRGNDSIHGLQTPPSPSRKPSGCPMRWLIQEMRWLLFLPLSLD